MKTTLNSDLAKNDELKALEDRAIHLAISDIWNEEAIDANIKILSIDPQNINAMNRLAKCYRKKGDFIKARKYYGKVLSVDPNNSIAGRQLQKTALSSKDEYSNANNYKTQTNGSSSRGGHYVNHCWKCGGIITSGMNRCSTCGWFICDRCHSCGCGFRGRY